MKRLTLVVLTLAFVIGLAVFAAPAPAQAAPQHAGTGLTATVLASQLYVRSGPSIRRGVLTAVNWGDVLTVLGRNERATWIKVVTADGTVGWVSVFWTRLSKNIPYNTIPVTQ